MNATFAAGVACVDGCYGVYTGQGWNYGGPAYQMLPGPSSDFACFDGCMPNFPGVGGYSWDDGRQGNSYYVTLDQNYYMPLGHQEAAPTPPPPSGWSTIQPVPPHGGDGIPPVSAVPEPSIALMLLAGVAIVAWKRKIR